MSGATLRSSAASASGSRGGARFGLGGAPLLSGQTGLEGKSSAIVNGRHYLLSGEASVNTIGPAFVQVLSHLQS